MNSSFFKNGNMLAAVPTGILVAALIFVLAFSLFYLTTKPRIWTDEAMSISLAQSFARHGVLNIELAQGQWWGMPYLLQATGYPVLAPLGVVFKLFGDSFTTARAYMLLWLVAAVLISFWFVRKFFNGMLAAAAALLIVGFPTVYGIGRTVLGEVPGFALTLLGLYIFLEKKNAMLAGFMFGLAVVAKPSVFGLLIPTVILLALMRSISFIELLYLAIGMLPAGLLSFVFIKTNPLDPVLWSNVLNFYKNPFFGSDPTLNIFSNLSHFFETPTLIYFSTLWLLLLVGSFFVKQPRILFLYRCILIYSLLAFFYYLRSPGYLRYIFPAELFILLLLPHAFFSLSETLKHRVAVFQKISPHVVAALIVLILAGVHFTHLFTGADISSGDDAIKTARYLDERYAGETVAILSDITIYALLQNLQRSVVVESVGTSVLGANPLLSDSLPAVVVSPRQNRFLKEGAEVIKKYYVRAEPVYNMEIYELQNAIQ